MTDVTKLRAENIFRAHEWLIMYQNLFNTADLEKLHPAAARLLEWANNILILYKYRYSKAIKPISEPQGLPKMRRTAGEAAGLRLTGTKKQFEYGQRTETRKVQTEGEYYVKPQKVVATKKRPNKGRCVTGKVFALSGAAQVSQGEVPLAVLRGVGKQKAIIMKPTEDKRRKTNKSESTGKDSGRLGTLLDKFAEPKDVQQISIILHQCLVRGQLQCRQANVKYNLNSKQACFVTLSIRLVLTMQQRVGRYAYFNGGRIASEKRLQAGRFARGGRFGDRGQQPQPQCHQLVNWMGKDNSLTKRKLRKIIEYAITEPTTEEETDPLRTYKYPFISSEVLSAANGSLLDLYFSTEPEEDPEEDLTNAKALKGKKALTVKLQNLVEEEESAPSTEKEPEAKENNNEVKEENKSEPEQETTEKKEVAATQGEEKKEESTPEQEPEKFAREKAILDKCIADLEAECTVEIADSCDNTAMGSDDSCSGNAGKYELVSLLFSFIDVDPGTELNELLAGYFKRAALTLIGGKPKEMAEYFENNASAIQNLFVHATNRSVSEVLCKALSIDETYITNPIRFTQMRNEILHGILTRLEDSGTETYSLDQLAQTFCDLADQSREVPALCCSLDVLRKLFALSLNKHYGIAASAIKILTKLLSMEKSAVVAHLKEQLSTLTVEREAPEHEPLSEGEELLKLIGNQLLAFKEILLEDQDTVENQFRVQIRPFGTHRLKIIEYFHALIKLTIFPIIDQIYRLQYPKLLYELFIRFPFNSVLHSLVYSIYKSVFELDCKSLLHVVTSGFC
eukprot:TRINITY_DN72462_c3_g1_i1.p1 TRINITY_DN72462_c3_g1~~TRINITY_DN72462_c3_g1_i1.p1  ORF type:complete len:795 (-),score=80.38 TRINITY_DN72462_c3_g1_i1:672-3056(-)